MGGMTRLRRKESLSVRRSVIRLGGGDSIRGFLEWLCWRMGGSWALVLGVGVLSERFGELWKC